MATTSWWSDGPQPGPGQMAVVLRHEDAGASEDDTVVFASVVR